ncbi:MAG: POTRA domain-containing protein, partial [Bryobacteraceae bacterium]
ATRFRYFVSDVTLDGAAEPPTKGQLLTAAKLELGSEFHEGDIEQAAEIIEERLRANGFYNAKVTSHVDLKPGTEEALIQFHVDTGDRARFDGVTFAGDFNKSPDELSEDTHWRRRFAGITLPGWRQVTENLVRNGVNRLLQDLESGDHLQASVTLEALNYHGRTNTVTPSLRIESGPVLELRTMGAKLSKSKLRQLIPVYEERTVDPGLLNEGRRNLVEYFQSQGFFDARVDFERTALAPGREVIDYRIVPNIRHKLVDLSIAGNHFFDGATLRERLSIQPASFPRSRWGRYSQKMLDNDLDAIRNLYRASGFREADVTAKVQDDYRGKIGQLAVHIQVREGPQWFVSKLEIQGAPDFDLPYLRSIVQSAQGEPFSQANIATDRDSILSYYYNNGYPNASFDWTQAPAGTAQRVNLTYTIRTGKREYVRSVIVRGLSTTRPSLVDSRIPLRPGDPLSENRMAESQQRLYDLGIFAKVQTAIQNPDGDEDNKYVLFDVDEANRYSFTAGIGAQLGRIGSGVTTFDEPAGATGFVPRISLGVSRLNFLGMGRTLSLQTRFSTIEQLGLL